MDAFGTAKNTVKPVAAQPPEMTADDLFNELTGDGQSYNTKVARWQADSQANIDAFGAYHSASTSNGGQMPAQYAQINDSGAPISMTTPGQDTHGKTTTGRPTTFATDTGEWARNPRQPGVSGQDRNVQPGQNQVRPNDQPTDQPINQPGYQVVAQTPGGGTSDSTHANSYVPQPVTPPAAQGGYQFGPTGQLVSNLGGGSGNQPYGGYSGFGPGTGTGTGTGPGTGTGSGTGTGARTGGGVIPRGPGSGSGARLPEERMPGQPGSRGTAGARGANGMPMGGAAGGRGSKDEDKEKKAAPYLKNPDPDETFGGFIEKPMPPVIGENRPK